MIRRILLFAVITLISAGYASAQSGLKARIDTLIKSLPAGSDVGISVYDLTAKEQLYSYRSDKLSRPASTMKLLTGITALSQKGHNDPFRTEAWYKGTIDRDTLYGDIYVIGGFDPEFSDPGMDYLVNAISELPFSVVTGTVYGDVSMTDSLYWGNGWVWDDDPASFQPYMSPLMFHKGKVTVTAYPTTKGDTASIQIEPVSTYYSLNNETKTKTPAAGKFIIDRNWLENGNTITVKGNVAGARKGEINLYSSKDFFMHTFIERLRAGGLSTDNVYGFNELVKDSTAVRIARWSTSMQDVLDELMKESDNLNAEAMLYRIGRKATGKKKVIPEYGLKVIEQKMKEIGYDPEDFNIVDGSGLSNYNYISPQLLVDFLKYAYSDTGIFQQLYKSLPTAGIDGTLKNRMKSTKAYKNVAAKTGSFTGINCLAGYVKRSDGHYLAFAIMNQNVLTGKYAREFQDKICEMLVTP